MMRSRIQRYSCCASLVPRSQPASSWDHPRTIPAIIHQHHVKILRCFSSSSNTQQADEQPTYTSLKGDKLRIAIVGGGCAGLSAALHLAPLVSQGLVAGPIDLFAGHSVKKREIGVGIWSTAVAPFQNDRESHSFVYKSITETHGTFLGKVGYRTPDGTWLMQSQLPTKIEEKMPSLIFLRELDLIETLQEAVHLEQQRGTVEVHHNSRIDGLEENSVTPWSAKLRLSSSTSFSDRDYHLVISADGMNSTLRHTYGGYEMRSRRLTGSGALRQEQFDTDYAMAKTDQDQHNHAVGLHDRGYFVFRGNAPISRHQLQQEEVSFQTWGTGNSMRFATVPMQYPTSKGREEHQVWFITTNDATIAAEQNTDKRKALLLEHFRDWHDPISAIVNATPADEILCEKAVAHNHCIAPIVSFHSQVIQSLRGVRPMGEGPAVVFLGDAFMTVDPILAQGFTCAMEGAEKLTVPVQFSCQEVEDGLAFSPRLLRRELLRRHSRRLDRLICLLRSTAMVEALGQPMGSIQVWVNQRIIRPLTRMFPNSIKAPFFDAVLRYSVGMHLRDPPKSE